jgi:hypothetical protein
MFEFPLNPHALMLTHEEKESDLSLSKLSDLFWSWASQHGAETGV